MGELLSPMTPMEKDVLWRCIQNRRDIRQFTSQPVPEEVVDRLLMAAHHAPSVGFSQPWDFIRIHDQAVKEQLAWAADKERRALAVHYEGDDRHERFLKLKVHGLIEAPLVIAVTSDPTRGGNHVLGRNSIPETDIMSVACGIQNMWLVAYSEGVAMGWVSFYKKADIRTILGIPPHIDPMALLCIGYPTDYPDRPVLEIEQWEKRQSLQPLIHQERW